MSLISLYPQLKASHVGLVMLSIALFTLRGVCILSDMKWPRATLVRIVAVVIDIGLVGTAVALLFALNLNPLHVAWLQVKLALLVAYIIFGSIAIKHARTRQARGMAYLAALACVFTMYTIARAHHPLGWLKGFLG